MNKIQHIPKGTARNIVDTVIGFNQWCKRWGDWHKGLKGRPDCLNCSGSGVTATANGQDDYDLERCNCMK